MCDGGKMLCIAVIKVNGDQDRIDHTSSQALAFRGKPAQQQQIKFEGICPNGLMTSPTLGNMDNSWKILSKFINFQKI